MSEAYAIPRDVWEQVETVRLSEINDQDQSWEMEALSDVLERTFAKQQAEPFNKALYRRRNRARLDYEAQQRAQQRQQEIEERRAEAKRSDDGRFTAYHAKREDIELLQRWSSYIDEVVELRTIAISQAAIKQTMDDLHRDMKALADSIARKSPV